MTRLTSPPPGAPWSSSWPPGRLDGGLELEGVDEAVGRYRVLVKLGGGGMADVFLAVALGPVGFSKLHVLKRLRSEIAAEPEAVAMFLDEARLAARLNHPNVVQTNEVVSQEGTFFLVMEYLDGEPFNRLMGHARGRGGLAQGVLLRVIADALGGLHYAHEFADYDGRALRIVHRDVSPHNIFVTYEGQTKLVDFGIAKAVTSSVQTGLGVIKGKVPYMSPEQARGVEVDRRSDIFSMGVVLWEALAERRLWHECNDAVILLRLACGDVPRLGEVRPHVPGPLAALCDRALCPDPAGRFTTAAAMRDALNDYLDRAGLNVTSVRVGAALGAAFAERRAQLQGRIERQLTALYAAAPNAPSIEVELAALSGRASSSVPEAAAGSTSATTGAAAPVAAGSGRPVADAGRRERERRTVALLLGGALAALGGVALVTRGGETKRANVTAVAATEAAPGAAPAEPRPSAVAPVASVEVLIAVKPPWARLYLDEAPVPANPYRLMIPPDPRTHQVRAEAAGFVAATRALTYERSTSVELVLEPAHARRAPAPPASAPRSGRRATKIDKADPWE